MSIMKRNGRPKSLKWRQANRAPLHQVANVDPSSSSESEVCERTCTSHLTQDLNGFNGFLYDLRQINSPTNPILSLPAQMAFAFLIVGLTGLFVFEPIAPYKFFSSKPKDKMPILSKRLGYVLRNSSYVLLWILAVELYKEYLRMLGYVRSRNGTVLSLDYQIRLNCRIKLTERLHIRSLSQFVLLLLCQLSIAIEPELIILLDRVVPALNAIYFLSRLADLYEPRRLKLFSMFIIYVPAITCLLLNILLQFIQMY